MDQDGLEQVKERLKMLKQSSEIVVSNAPRDERGLAWLNLLQHFGTVYSKLEQAAKGTPASQKWFVAKKAERKSDELLRYLHHARNAGEHSIVRSESRVDWAISGRVTGDGSGISLGVAFDKSGHPTPFGQGMEDIQFFENEVLLNAALDRGIYYRPPETHRNQPIKSQKASDIVPYLVAYADIMVSEAASLPAKH